MEPSPPSVLSLTTCLVASPYLNRAAALLAQILSPGSGSAPKAVEPETVTATGVCPSTLLVPDNREGPSFPVSGDCRLLGAE